MKTTEENLNKLLNCPIKIKSSYMKKYIDGMIIKIYGYYHILSNYRYFNYNKAPDEYSDRYKYMIAILPSDIVSYDSYYNKLDILPLNIMEYGEL